MKFLVVYCTYVPAVCDVCVLDCAVCSVFPRFVFCLWLCVIIVIKIGIW